MADSIIGKISVGDGATFTPAVSNEGVLSWSNNKNLANPADFDIPGKVLERGVDVLGLAPIASPAFTGTPTAPTPTPGDSSIKIATTAYVQAELQDYVTLNNLETELQDYLPLSGGNITGNLSVAGVMSANAINTLQRNTAYSVGDIVYSATLGTRYYLECTVAGTTGATEPSFTTGG